MAHNVAATNDKRFWNQESRVTKNFAPAASACSITPSTTVVFPFSHFNSLNSHHDAPCPKISPVKECLFFAATCEYKNNKNASNLLSQKASYEISL